jgi:hypothetical protein
MRDIKIISTLNGGDLVKQGNDIATVSGVENVPFLAMFGGASWCLNFLSDKPFQSRTETVLRSVVLNSEGRLKIQEAVNADLAYLSDIAGTTWNTTVALEAPNYVRIGVTINGQLFDTLWNPTTPVDEVSLTAICPLITGLTVVSTSATSIVVSWDASTVAAYEYRLLLVNITPPSGTETTANTVTFTGLTPGLTYYIFVRSKCAEGFYSAWVSVSAITVAVAPITSGLVMELYSFQGVTRTGTDIDVWADQTVNNNDLVPDDIANPPQYEAAVFGTLPSITFDNSVSEQSLITAADMVGAAGQTGITVFTVSITQDVPSSNYLWSYSDVPSGVMAGEVEAYQSTSIGINFVGRGNVGLQSGSNADTPTAANVTAVILDFTQEAADEATIYVNGSNASYVSGATSANTGTFSSAPMHMGQGNVQVGAMLVYNRALSPSEITTITNYLTGLFIP